MRFGYRSFIKTLPGQNKFVLDVSSDNDFVNKFNNLMPHDTVVLYTVDVWRSYQYDHIVRDHPQLQGKNVFVLTLGYENRRIGDQCWILSFPFWYIRRELPKDEKFVPRPQGLEYGYGSLNNRPSHHRLLLGHALYQNELLSSVIFTQNNTQQMSHTQTKEYPAGEIDAELICDSPQWDMVWNTPGFDQYKRLLPIRWKDKPITNTHYVHHDAELLTYANILTEAMIDDINYSEESQSLITIPLPIMSEKSWRPFAAGQVPIFLAAIGHLPYLQSLGFETMDELYPAGFDSMPMLEKINAIVDIVKQGRDFIEDFYYAHLREIQHNHELVVSDRVDQLIVNNIKNFIEV
jgi:hypothetical protein